MANSQEQDAELHDAVRLQKPGIYGRSVDVQVKLCRKVAFYSYMTSHNCTNVFGTEAALKFLQFERTVRV